MMIRRLIKTRRFNTERGSVIVEASLTLILSLTLLLALIDFGLSLYLHQSFVNQARSGARYGAIHPDPVAVKNVVLYGRPNAGTGAGINGLAPNSVAVTRLGTPTTATDRIVVTITGYTFTWIAPGFAGSKTGKPISVSMPVEY
jgi:hypothetical protein